MIDGQSWATRARGVDAGSCRMHVAERDGDGPIVVLVHGLGASVVLWNRLVAALPEDVRVVAVDLRGSGETRELDGAAVPLSPEVWAADLHAALVALDVPRAVMVGHSLGSTVALEHALRWPEAVSGLVLMCIEARLSALGPRMQRSADMIREHGMEGWVTGHWANNPPFSATSLAAEPELLDEYRTMLLANRADDYVRACEAIVNAGDLTPRLGEVTQPATVIVGGEDDRTRPEDGQRMAEAIPGADFVAIPGAGHTVPMEAPEATAAAILALLDRVDDAPAVSR
jgi:pimeloyl-ACP methyl ester carboxylesterase